MIVRLPHNKRTTRMPVLFVLDTEARIDNSPRYPQYHRLRLGVCLRYVPPERHRPESVTYYTFTQAVDLWKWVSDKVRVKESNLLIAHNAAYDTRLTDVFLLVEKFQWESVFRLIDEPSFILKFRRKENNGRYTYLTIISTTNYVKVPLSELGKQIGLPKLDVDFKRATDEELLTYCKRDVDILFQWFKRYVQWLIDNDLGKLSLTAPSQALSAFRHRFMSVPIYFHNDAEVREIERHSYRGGRTECFYLGGSKDNPIYQVDVNSMYPYVMREYSYPTIFVRLLKDVKVERLAELLKRYLAIAYVTVHTDIPSYGVRYNDRLVFPVGTFVAHLTTPELAYALAHKHLVHIHKLAIYEGRRIFVQYVDFFYNERKKAREKGDMVADALCKLLLNSLYGKFGQYSVQWDVVGECDTSLLDTEEEFDAETGKKIVRRFVLGKVEERVGRVERLFAAPSIASHITAYARQYLLHLITTAGWDNVYYCDTDSLYVNTVGLERLKDYLGETELGKLKIAGEYERMRIYAPKSYHADTLVKRKGIRKDAKQLDDNLYEQEQWRSFKWNVKYGIRDYVQVELIRKRGYGKYEKGIVTDTGKVLPLSL